jgi:hypothetical protein
MASATDRDVDRFVLHRCDDAPSGSKHPPFRKKGPMLLQRHRSNDFEVDFYFLFARWA